MKPFSFDETASRIRAWRASLPSLPHLLIGAAIVAIGAWVTSAGGPDKARLVADQVVEDLMLLQPFGIIGIYFDGMPCSGWISVFECRFYGAFSFFHPGKGIGRLFATVGEIWSESGVPGRIILPLALIASFPVAMALVYRLFRKLFGTTDINGIHLALAAVLTPFVASVVALILQGVAIALFSIFGAVLGLILFMTFVTGGVLACWGAIKNVVWWARFSEKVVLFFRKK